MVERRDRQARVAGLAVLVAVVVLAVGAGCRSGARSGTDAFTGPWTGPQGRPAERGESREFTYEVMANEGPDHCEWQSAVFLHVGWPLGTTQGVTVGSSESRQFIRDPAGAIPFTDGLDLDAELPAGAERTGYESDGVELWFGDDEGERWAYLVREDGTVERWPRDVGRTACA